MPRRGQRGVTLIELVMVIVLLGILSTVLAPLIGTHMDAFVDTRERSDLTARGRLALERLAREVRHAVPNTLQTLDTDSDGTHDGVEFLRSRAGGRYVAVGDPADGGWCVGPSGTAFHVEAYCFEEGQSRERLYALGMGLVRQPGDLLVIGNTRPDDLSLAAVELDAVEPTTASADGIAGAHILRFGARTFTNGSPGQHFFIADDVIEVGLEGSTLRWFQQSGLASYDNGSGDWSAASPVLVEGVADVAFTYTPGTAQGTAVLRIRLELEEGDEHMVLYQEVQVRNAM